MHRTELKKLVRGVRPLEREVAQKEGPIAKAVYGYCLAVRSSLTDDGHPPLDTPDLKLHERLTQIHDSLERVEKSFQDLMELMSAQKQKVGSEAEGIEHFLKITCSYWPGLFHCYSVDGLPRTNNDLEQVFGSFRHHQRRCTGQKKSPASLLVRGSCRLISAIATKVKTFFAQDLVPLDLSAWRQKRNQMEQLRQNRLEQRRFRRSTSVVCSRIGNSVSLSKISSRT